MAESGRFCAECGGVLDAEVLQAPSAAPIPAAPVAERRVTTVLFADLVGFTTLAEGRDSEDVRELLSAYFTVARTIVGRYGGTVEKFIGDAVMAVWGAPAAHEDDAERAVRAGLELVTGTEELGRDEGAPGLTMRVGVVTGEVAVTLGATGEGMVAGDAVNTASRVQAATTPGHVWVDDATRSLSAAAISYEPTGEHELKGKSQPLRLFEAGAVVASLRGAERVDGLEAPITGRDRELRLVKELFHATEEGRHPSLVLVEGEPGVGKSRIAWEFEKYIDGLRRSVAWHRGRCLAYGDGVAFWALAEAVRGRLGLVDTDSGPAVEQALDEGLERYVPGDADRAWLRPRLAVLIGTQTTNKYATEELFAAWSAFLKCVGVVVGEPVVLVVDDMHHADDGFLDFLEHVLSTTELHIFVMALARTGLLARRPQLASNQRTTVLHLHPLGRDAMATLLDGLVADLPAATRDVLVQRSEGVPLFAVETVRGLIDQDLVVPQDGRYVPANPAALDLSDLSAPASLQALVAARLDALSPVERRVVSDASVLGMSFPEDAIASLTPDLADRDEVLKSLVRKQILDVETDRFSATRGQFRFVQGVMRQVAYDMLSHRDRKARHLAVAHHLEAQGGANGEVVPILAQHYLDAVAESVASDRDRPELVERATTLLDRASDRARAVGAPREALRYLKLAMQFTDDSRSAASLRAKAAKAALACGEHELSRGYGEEAVAGFEALDDLVRAGEAAADLGESISRGIGDNAAAIDLMAKHWERLVGQPGAEPALLRLALQLGTSHLDRGEADLSTPYLHQTIRLAEGIGDRPTLGMALSGLGRHYAGTGAPYTAIKLFEAAAEVARVEQQPLLLSRALFNASTELLPRDVGRAVEMDREAMSSARQSGDANTVMFSAVNLALALWTSGDWDELEALLGDEQLFVDMLEDNGALTVIGGWLGEARGQQPRVVNLASLDDSDNQSDIAWAKSGQLLVSRREGDLATAARLGAEVVQHAVAWSGIGDDFMHLWPPAVLACIDARQLDAAERLLEPARSSPRGLLTPAISTQLHRLEALILAARGVEPDRLEALLRSAVDECTSYGAPPLRASCQAQLARWLIEQGRSRDASPLLAAAEEAFSALGAAGWQRRFGMLADTMAQ